SWQRWSIPAVRNKRAVALADPRHRESPHPRRGVLLRHVQPAHGDVLAVGPETATCPPSPRRAALTSSRPWPASTAAPTPAGTRARNQGEMDGRGALPGADDLEVLVDEDVVRPVDADVVDLVLAVAQLHNTVDDAPPVGGQRSFRRLVRCRSADDRPRPLTVVRRDLTDLL